MIKALVIGCGNIGAGYDLNDSQVLTHAKAFSLNKEIFFCVSDTDEEKAKSIGKVYGVPYFVQLSDDDLSRFDMVSLCVSTQYHFEYLERLAKLKVPFVLCEKPIVNNLSQLKSVKELSIDENSIMVNYIRRFQPGFRLLKQRLSLLLETDSIRQIVVRYQKGILNNCSHALDLISFLTDTKITIKDFVLFEKHFDHFEFDPTISGAFFLRDISVSLVGLTNISYSLFEIDIYLGRDMISIKESGDTIFFFKEDDGQLKEVKEWRQKKVLKNYMIPVIKTAVACMRQKEKTNFSSALHLNEEILKIIEINK
jgi:predicted dehydrogenase